MSRIVTIKRKITPEELREALKAFGDFEIDREQSRGMVIKYKPDESAHIILAEGELQATSPTNGTLQGLVKIAATLDAQLVDDDEAELPSLGEGSRWARQAQHFWPVLCALLSALLIWKW